MCLWLIIFGAVFLDGILWQRTCLLWGRAVFCRSVSDRISASLLYKTRSGLHQMVNDEWRCRTANQMTSAKGQSLKSICVLELSSQEFLSRLQLGCSLILWLLQRHCRRLLEKLGHGLLTFSCFSGALKPKAHLLTCGTCIILDGLDGCSFGSGSVRGQKSTDRQRRSSLDA